MFILLLVLTIVAEIKHDKSTGDVVVTNLTQVLLVLLHDHQKPVCSSFLLFLQFRARLISAQLPVQSEEEIYRIIQSASRRRETASTVR